MTKNTVKKFEQILKDQEQCFKRMTELFVELQVEKKSQENMHNYFSSAEDNIIYPNCFSKSLKTKKAVSDESNTTNQYIFKISLSELQHALNSGSDEEECACILKVPVVILRDAIQYYQSKGLL